VLPIFYEVAESFLSNSLESSQSWTLATIASSIDWNLVASKNIMMAIKQTFFFLGPSHQTVFWCLDHKGVLDFGKNHKHLMKGEYSSDFYFASVIEIKSTIH
jgi:hypothetical protein